VRRRLTAIRAGLSNLWPVILPGLVIALAIGTSLNFWLLIPALSKLKTQSQEGQKARATQCEREPVIAKVADAAYAVRRALPADNRITSDELKLFHARAPRCPRR
jgi:hypothetical protein